MFSLAVIGPRWLEKSAGQRRIDDPTDLVRREIIAAFEQGKPVIPIVVDDGEFPSVADLPEPLRPLLARNGIRLPTDEGFDEGVEVLVKRIREEVATKAAAEAGQRGSRKPLTPRQWAKVAAMAPVVIAGIAIGFYVALQEMPDPRLLLRGEKYIRQVQQSLCVDDVNGRRDDPTYSAIHYYLVGRGDREQGAPRINEITVPILNRLDEAVEKAKDCQRSGYKDAREVGRFVAGRRSK